MAVALPPRESGGLSAPFGLYLRLLHRVPDGVGPSGGLAWRGTSPRQDPPGGGVVLGQLLHLLELGRGFIVASSGGRLGKQNTAPCATA